MSAAAPDGVHFYSALAEASQHLTIVTADDIYDTHRIKLVSRGHTLGAEQLMRLSQLKLARALEVSVVASDGVVGETLEREVLRQCEASNFIKAVVGVEVDRIRHLCHSVELDPFSQLMLSIQQATRPKLFARSVLCGALTTAVLLRQRAPLLELHKALKAGLLHDCGEMYARSDLPDLILGPGQERWSEFVAHAEIGGALIECFTDCPASIGLAVRQHHERLDGSGYPDGLTSAQMSPLARVVSVAETICGLQDAADNHAARAKLALSIVAGEFDSQVVNKLFTPQAAKLASAVSMPAEFDLSVALARAKLLSRCLDTAHQAIASSAQAHPQNEQVLAVLEVAHTRLGKLRTSWTGTGLGEYFFGKTVLTGSSEGDEELFFDLDVVPQELRWRMRSLARTIVLMSGQRCPSASGAFQPIVRALNGELGTE